MEKYFLLLAIVLSVAIICCIIKFTKEPIDIENDKVTTIHDNSKNHKISDLSPDFDATENLLIKQNICNCFSGVIDTDSSVVDNTPTFNDGQNGPSLDWSI